MAKTSGSSPPTSSKPSATSPTSTWRPSTSPTSAGRTARSAPAAAASITPTSRTRRIWKCKACKRQFSVKVGTIFEDSPLGLDKWLPAIWLAANSKNGISSHELARALGVTQKSAWFMLHRIRLAMQTGSFAKLVRRGRGRRDLHRRQGPQHAQEQPEAAEDHGRGRPSATRPIVVGMIERGGTVRAAVVPDVKRNTLHGRIRETVEPGSAALHRRAASPYTGLDADYDHRVRRPRRAVRGRARPHQHAWRTSGAC